jgi:hypothetical protein
MGTRQRVSRPGLSLQSQILLATAAGVFIGPILLHALARYLT